MKASLRGVGRISAMIILAVVALPLGSAQSDVLYEHSVYLPLVISPPVSHCGTVRVFDFEGVERDWAWLVATFGSDVGIDPGDGSACVTELRALHDDSTLIIRVKDPQNQPLGGIPVVFYWPDAQLLPPALLGCYDRGDVAYTKYPPDDGAGSAGFGMYGGSWYCAPTGSCGQACTGTIGPHTVWVGVVGSDCVHGLGMACGTNHDHVNVTYMLTGE